MLIFVLKHLLLFVANCIAGYLISNIFRSAPLASADVQIIYIFDSEKAI